MGEWEKTFAKRVGRLREAWTGEFHRIAEQEIQPAYRELEEFLVANGFKVSVPQSNADLWSFKFSMGEDVYALVSFRLQGACEVEATGEVVVPGREGVPPLRSVEAVKRVRLDWAETQFRRTLEQFVSELESSVSQESWQRA